MFSFNIDGSKICVDNVNGYLIWNIDPSTCDYDCDCWPERESDDEVFIPIHLGNKGKKNEHFHKHCCKSMPTRRHYSLDDPNSL